MRDLTTRPVHQYRLTNPEFYKDYLPFEEKHFGLFKIPSPETGEPLRIIASNGDGWDHVSVSLANRCPTWYEMDYVMHIFFKVDEIAFQLHVPRSSHINIHPNTLHIWRPHIIPIPLPPSKFV